MDKKKFKLSLEREGKETFAYESQKDDSLVLNEKGKTLKLSLIGDTCKGVESARFDKAIVKLDKKTKTLSAKSISKVLDNGVTKITFNLK